jgi:hypothetical protein
MFEVSVCIQTQSDCYLHGDELLSTQYYPVRRGTHFDQWVHWGYQQTICCSSTVHLCTFGIEMVKRSLVLAAPSGHVGSPNLSCLTTAGCIPGQKQHAGPRTLVEKARRQHRLSTLGCSRT